jgi:hypothetical protein
MSDGNVRGKRYKARCARQAMWLGGVGEVWYFGAANRLVLGNPRSVKKVKSANKHRARRRREDIIMQIQKGGNERYIQGMLSKWCNVKVPSSFYAMPEKRRENREKDTYPLSALRRHDGSNRFDHAVNGLNMFVNMSLDGWILGFEFVNMVGSWLGGRLPGHNSKQY